MNFMCHHNAVTRGVILGYRCKGDENCAIVGYYYSESGGNSLQSVNNYHHLMRNNNPE
jgi:hypothetical protein